MAEVYPDDQSLLALSSDAETGVEYIATGTAPYYLEFRKLLQRLLVSCRRANDLRVFDEGGLAVGVKAGSFMRPSDGAQVDYAGSSGNVLSDDATNYLYLDVGGLLVVGTSGFPATSVEHVRLAKVVATAGDIVSLEDHRGVHLFRAFG